MPYELENRLVVGVASSALFDLAESDDYFRKYGEDDYRRYQDKHIDDRLLPGVAFPFIQRLLGLNDLRADTDPVVEVIVLSKNDPSTGLRVLRSVKVPQSGHFAGSLHSRTGAISVHPGLRYVPVLVSRQTGC